MNEGFKNKYKNNYFNESTEYLRYKSIVHLTKLLQVLKSRLALRPKPLKPHGPFECPFRPRLFARPTAN